MAYNGKPYTNSKDLLYAAMLSGKDIQLSGYHVDYVKGIKQPFNYTIKELSPPGIRGHLDNRDYSHSELFDLRSLP